MLLHNHLDMIGRNEPIQRKARFWQSYVRALKGTDDIRAPEASHYSRYPSPRGIFRPLAEFPTFKSIFDDPIAPSDRISSPGYRYLPISRDTYGLSPRNIYPHHYSSLDRVPRYDRDYSNQIQGEFKLDQHGHFQYEYFKAPSDWDAEEGREPDQKYLNPAYRRRGLPLIKEYEIGPDGSKVPLYTHTGHPIYSRGGFKRPMTELYEPSPWIPISRETRVPWWWSYPQYRPFEAPYVPMKHSPYFLRDSFLSPVKRSYLWKQHPIRPFSEYEIGDDGRKYPLYGYSGKPTYLGSGEWLRPLRDLLEPSPHMPLSRITRDPWWWSYINWKPTPYIPLKHLPSYLRNSYLSHIKRNYLWNKHPIRPFFNKPLSLIY
ncbi:unnamed protein product [Nezara viridula]|uniref:Uncharacterized protein n=1 Tax=Nezara viridula TaxID=85310 RepID=A0A9P0E5N1_NEZVI|nr:unnamed protein product [Nezara viridula]